MTLKHRVKKLESQIESGKDKLHIIVGPEDSLDAQVQGFRQQNPDFDGILVVVTDCYKPLDAGRSV